jgi:SAM-dependent methyltransferase
MKFDESFWDERYRQHGSVWSPNPNPHLLAEAAGLRPGSVLDVGSGEGADSLWLARQGWRVTAVDISSVALARAAERAAQDAEAAARITWVHHDLTSSPPPSGTFDLVSAQFMHLPLAERTELYHRLAASVSPACCSPRRKSRPGWIRTSGRSTSAKPGGGRWRTRTAAPSLSPIQCSAPTGGHPGPRPARLADLRISTTNT